MLGRRISAQLQNPVDAGDVHGILEKIHRVI